MSMTRRATSARSLLRAQWRAPSNEKGAAGCRGAFSQTGAWTLVGQRRLGAVSLDGDRPRLLLLGDLALQLDRQQAIGQLRAHDLHMVGELEAALEVAAGDAAIQI